MSDSRPLAGKRVVVTRAPEQSGELIAQLEKLGAEVILLPVVRYEDPTDAGPLRHAIAGIPRFDWLIFTSQNAVRFFVKHNAAAGGKVSAGGGGFPKVAAVGPATAEAARDAAFSVAFVAGRFEGKALAGERGSV